MSDDEGELSSVPIFLVSTASRTLFSSPAGLSAIVEQKGTTVFTEFQPICASANQNHLVLVSPDKSVVLLDSNYKVQ
jgi:hypothetical protein